MEVNKMNVYLNIYLQSVIVFGIVYLIKDLILTFMHRYKMHKRYLEHINNKDIDKPHYLQQRFDCRSIIVDYLPIFMLVPLIATFWPIYVLKKI